MSPGSRLPDRGSRRFPRVSGDEPRLLDCPALYKWFSPRERG